ncbi:MAG: periplasmic heavy metal sensor [Magnetococcales bacterium]|nr:periplasmic heavy metal sensor [Magnetococcales bacterium]
MIQDKRLLWPLLLLSLAVNLFLGGMVASRLLSSDPPAGSPMPGNPLLLGLSRHDLMQKPELATIWQQHHAEVQQAMHTLRAAQQQVRESLQAQPWDRSRLEKALSDLRHAAVLAQEQWHGVLAEIAALLPANERSNLVGDGHFHRPGGGMGLGMGRHGGNRSP